MSDPKVTDSNTSMWVEVSLAGLVANLKIHAKFMSKKGVQACHTEMEEKTEQKALRKPLNFQKKLEIGILSTISWCLFKQEKLI